MSKNNYAGKEVTRTMYLTAKRCRWAEEGDYSLAITVYGPEIHDDDTIFLAESEFTMTVPDHADLDSLTVEAMRKEQDKISAEAHLKVQNIEETIQSMLALPAPGGIINEGVDRLRVQRNCQGCI